MFQPKYHVTLTDLKDFMQFHLDKKLWVVLHVVCKMILERSMQPLLFIQENRKFKFSRPEYILYY